LNIRIPELALVVLVGASGSGKSTFARKHFLATEILSSDYCRGLVADDENDQTATKDAFEVLNFIAAKRLAAGRLTVIDATSTQAEARKPLVELARRYHCLPVAIVLDVPEATCHERNRQRADRNFGLHVVSNQRAQLRKSLAHLQREGFRHISVLHSVEEVEAATLVREPLWNNRKSEHGPFDIIGDIHGCLDELLLLLDKLGYALSSNEAGMSLSHPEGRRAVFVGDLVDRGPASPGVIRLVMNSVAAGTALCVAGNHDVKLARKLRGKDVKITHGLAESLVQLESTSKEFRCDAAEFLDDLVSHYVLDDGKLVVAHAGLKEEMHGRGSGAVRSFCMYGETTGETDDFGLPVRYNWAQDYRGKAMVVYGHTPVPSAEWLNNTICIDTGCVFGGTLTALRYPERELVAVPAVRTYYEPVRPLVAPARRILSAQQENDDVLDIDDVSGKRFIETALGRAVTIREENAIAALEVMSRFAANPRWLVYLPPTMSPSETHAEGFLLEHPREAFDYFRRSQIDIVVCEEKHMGSRAIVVVCRDEQVALRRFGVQGEGRGIVYTRTGRRFFNEPALEAEFVSRVAAALEEAKYFAEFESDWFVLDCELMPWSAKAQDLLRKQYAAVGAAASVALQAALQSVASARPAEVDMSSLHSSLLQRSHLVDRYIESYRRYCWPTDGIQGLRLAPFHLLASEGRVHADKDHVWHMEMLAKLAAIDPALFVATPFRRVSLQQQDQVAAASVWWEELTGEGGEGMVVKPLQFTARGAKGLVQPALKCRGPEYLRIIYGPEYDLPQHIERLRNRGLSGKRGLAMREFSLGIEGLTRFVNREPLRRVHECVFGVLALESEPIDPRL
jgi:polynucleotide kinase-phosphatase